MAIRLEIDNADNRGRVDYTRYLASPGSSPAVLRDRMSQPALFDFGLVPSDDHFVAPRRSAFVILMGLADGLPPGGPRVAGPLFTGFITNEPAIDFLGTQNGRAIHGFRCQATSEDYLLNVKRMGVLPPMLNQTAGQIVRFLTEHLQPGRFDTSQVEDGAFIPFFAVDPDRTWSDVARELAERSAFSYRVLDGQVFFHPVAAEPAGIAIDETERNFRPESLDVAPLGNPVQNDVTVFGEIEPQAHVREHFAGDGFQSRFSLALPVFGAESARLLADDFTGVTLDSAVWQETDPGGHITPFEGRLNVTGGNGNLNATTLLARQAIELGGELEIVHGEFEFVAPSTGILGGLYSASALTQANCLLGFDASPAAGTTRIRALVAGVVEPPEVLVVADRHYVLVSRLSADRPYRTEQSFSSLGAAYGGAALAANIQVTIEVQEIDLADPASRVTTILYENTLATLPPFAFYAPINSADLHVAANFLQISRPIQARLEMQRPGEPVRLGQLGFGVAQHDATITADPNRNQWALEFYEDTIPARGETITLHYRAAGRAQARVRDAASLAAEAALAGDDGVRATVLRDVYPSPRTSVEAELAAQAYLADHVQSRYEGRYATWGEFAVAFPRSGRLVEVRCESRYPAFAVLVRGVTSELRELGSERVLHTLEFGQPSRFEDLLRQFSPPDRVLRGEEPAALPAVELDQVGTQFLEDVAGFALSQVLADHFAVDMGAAPPAGGRYEVRRSDQGWSSASAPASAQNLIGSFTAQTFLLLRTARRHSFFIRPVDANGLTSRHSSVIAIQYPMVPPVPQSLTVALGIDEEEKPAITAEVAVSETGIVDVDAVELRDSDDTTVLARWDFSQLQLEGASYRARLVLDNSVSSVRSKILYAYTRNALGEYSTAQSATGSKPQPLKPFLTTGNSVGQILEILLDRIGNGIVETQIQIAPPNGGFAAPAQDVTVPGEPEKFNFVATQSGGWPFRARRRDELGWSPWSDESQGQIPAQTLTFAVHFFQAQELDPSIGAAVNPQNLLPNAEMFLSGIAGQEGTHSARYFGLTNAAADGSEVDYSVSTNEMHWKSGVNFASGNPGFRTLLTNLGRLFNPGEALTLSAALRHDGSAGFSKPVRFALRSASTPAYDRNSDVAAGTIAGTYQWFSVTFTLPSSQAVPADLSAEIAVVIAAGQPLASSLFCDKAVLNRGHRPAAFSLAPWDVVALAWNGGAGAYDLPATIVPSTSRSTDPGNAGRLAGTGTEDLDPDFTGRYFRQLA